MEESNVIGMSNHQMITTNTAMECNGDVLNDHNEYSNGVQWNLIACSAMQGNGVITMSTMNTAMYMYSNV